MALIRNLTIIFLYGFLLLGCRNKDSEIKFVIGFSQCTGGDAWRKQMLSEMESELQFHSNLTMLYRDAAGSNAKQVAHIEELIKLKVDLLIVTPNEAEPITPIIERAYQLGIPVIIVDRKTTSNLYTAYIGADNYEIGKLAGSYATSLLSGGGRILEIWGLKGSSPAIDRDRGFREALLNYPNIQVTKTIDGSWELDSVKNLLQKNPINPNDYDLVFAHNDVMAFGAYSVVHQASSKVLFMGIDGLPGPGNGIEMVSDGVFSATFLYPTGGEESIQLASRILRGENVPKENMLNSTVIDSRNVRVMKLQTDKILGQRKDIQRQQNKIDEQLKLYSNQRTLIYILLGCLVVVLVLGAYALLAWREKSEANERLETQKLEIQNQRDKVEEMASIAEEANQAKLKFFTNVSHEFKTPLTLILGPLDELLSQKPSDSIQESLKLIKRNAIRLLLLVNQIMDLRKIDYKKMSLQSSENDLVLFVKEIYKSFEPLSKSQNIEFKLEINNKPQKVWFDSDKLDKVIFNLLSNAFKFTAENGKIKLSVTFPESSEVLIAVEDNGKGMTEEEANQVFDRFYSVEQENKGTGLGMALSKEFIELHHGKIFVSSEKWKGTKFTIVLPLGNAHLKPSEIALENIKRQQSLVYDSLNDLPITPETDSEDSVFEHTILIIDDNAELRRFIKRNLRSAYNIYEAGTGSEGLQKTFDLVPDVVICDVMLPVKNGFEITTTLKTDQRTSHIPVILLTAKSSIEQKIEGVQTGADEYITKPFVFDYLKERIKSLLRNREVLRQHYNSQLELSPSVSSPGSLDKKFISTFHALIEKNLSNADLNVNEIAEELGMSRIQVYRKVKALLGCAVNDYLVEVRIKKAKHLLKNSEMSIAEIAYEVGFSSPAYFSTTFKGKTTLSPKEYKSSTSL